MMSALSNGLKSIYLKRTIATAAPSGPPSQQAARVARVVPGQSHQHENAPLPTSSLLFFGVPIAVTFSLGVWQVKRLQRKLRMIEQRENRLSADPLQAKHLFQSNSDIEYRRVRISGRFLHSKEMLVGPRSAPQNLPTPVLQWGGSSGLQVITPFELDTGEIVLVNRGWVPQRLAIPSKRSQPLVSPLPFLTTVTEATPLQDYKDGDQVSDRTVSTTFVGIVRGRDERSRFTPDNKPEKDEWYYIDPLPMMRAVHLDRSATDAVVVELLDPLPKSGWPFPRGCDEFMKFRTPPSTHVTYAATWFSLSAALALLTRHRMRQPLRKKAAV